MAFEIRSATTSDLPQIIAIMNQEILHGTANWRDEIRSLAQYSDWFESLQQNNFPLLVAVVSGTDHIAAFADYDRFREIQGYRHTVEHSVFVHPDYARQGLGKSLMLALIQSAKTQHIHVMVAAIDLENTASIYLHQQLGFKQTGLMPQVGKKFGQWRDLVLMQLNFDQDAVMK
ncbi:phosphinothricin acetyltransferase [Acinetobacter calcoaceticus]|uniref:Phosphinothricin acetyltransferase n=1 Tax=Acinetobacter calcoaceticus TaxID=471 RepID=A0A4R1XZT2_ACICA|nr:phosphinothricin acetyltransferase [Acinetobacter calcoaceticus]